MIGNSCYGLQALRCTWLLKLVVSIFPLQQKDCQVIIIRIGISYCYTFRESSILYRKWRLDESLSLLNSAWLWISTHQEHNLYHIMRERQIPFSEGEIRSFMSQMLQGLAHMHRNGYFHRDLKPGKSFTLTCYVFFYIKIAIRISRIYNSDFVLHIFVSRFC